jgi:hypothetical protein
MFLEYADYKTLGGKLEASQFTQSEFVARQRINELTFNRIATEEPMEREAVKMCIFGLIERGYLGSLDGDDWTNKHSGSLSKSREGAGERKTRADDFIRSCLTTETANGKNLLSLVV